MSQSELQTKSGEIMLFGVRVKVDPIRKSVSMSNLSQYEHPANGENVGVGYASADDVVRGQGSRERKRGIPWTEDEHKLFLLGLEKVGKGDWRGISRSFVKTRTPTQVASHAQKYFLRRTNLNRGRRRSSLFDITTDSVAAMPTEEHQVKIQDKKSQVVLQPSTHQISPIPIYPTPNPSTRMDLMLNRNYETDPLPVSLNLSLSYDRDRSSTSYQVISRFNNGDNMISVN